MTTTITIDQEDLGDGVMRYWVRMSGELVWSGLGGSPVRPLLRKLAELDRRAETDCRGPHRGPLV